MSEPKLRARRHPFIAALGLALTAAACPAAGQPEMGLNTVQGAWPTPVAAATIAAAGDVPATAPTASRDAAAPSRLALVAEGSRLRHGLAIAPTGLLAAIDPAEAQALRQAFGNPDALALTRWADLLAASTQFFRVGAFTADSLWWNPLLDAGVAVRWRWASTRWRVAEATAFTGATLRGDSEGPPPLDAASLRRLALATRAATARGAADALYTGPGEAVTVLARLREASAALVGVSGDAALAVRRQSGGRRLLTVPGTPGGAAGPTLAAMLTALSPDQRQALAPYRQAARGYGLTVAWASAGAPDTVFLLHYDQAAAVYPRAVDIVPIIPPAGGRP